VFTDDSILVEKYLTEYRGSSVMHQPVSTRGTVSVHINSNRQGNGMLFDSWIDFACNWTDGNW
jgi:hypothetical protein